MGAWPIICVAAQKRNGKGETADYLTRALNERCAARGMGRELWCQRGFSDAIKETMVRFFGVSRAWLEEWKIKPEMPVGFKMTVREAMVLLANSFRQVRENVWIESLFREISQPTIINDARFALELEASKRQGGFNIMVYRPGRENYDGTESEMLAIIEYLKEVLPEGGRVRPEMVDTSAGLEGVAAGEEEMGLARKMAPRGAGAVDWFLVNDGSLDDLRAKIDEDILPLLAEEFKLTKALYF